MLRRLIRHPRTQAAIAGLLGGYLSFVARTTRWSMVGEELVDAVLGGAYAPRGIIVGFWHERLAIVPLAWQHYSRLMPALEGARVHVLVSQHRDGRLIGEIAGRFDVSMVYGSSTRGGGAGLLALARLIEEGEHVAITPDGPRGPRRKAAAGIAHLAAQTGQPVVAIGTSASRARLLGSWDRMMVPLPFGRGVIAVQPPILVPRDGAEAALPAIEAALSAACDAADRAARGGIAA